MPRCAMCLTMRCMSCAVHALQTCVLFPGQGAQKKGMADKLMSCTPAKALFDKAAEILGYDLAALIRDGPQEKLDQTLYAQPAVFVTALAAVEKAKIEQFETLGRTKTTAGFSVRRAAPLLERSKRRRRAAERGRWAGRRRAVVARVGGVRRRWRRRRRLLLLLPPPFSPLPSSHACQPRSTPCSPPRPPLPTPHPPPAMCALCRGHSLGSTRRWSTRT